MEKLVDIAMPSAAHPYYPLEAEIVGYLANEYSTPMLLALFVAGCAVIIGVTSLMVNGRNPNLPTAEKATIMWFVICGFIHFFFEGYFALNHTRMGPAQNLFGQLWKEYAKSDSRYLTSDPFVLCMESLTAICWGPLGFVVAWMITTSNPLRHPLQIIISLGQIYGDVLYYATSVFDLYYKGLAYSRPEFYYFWGYFFLVNFIWIVIPGLLLCSSVAASAKAFKALDKMAGMLHGNGAVKKSL
ncbi:MAG: hypothetical protein M1823_000688 [Watsoniomyces obsoletus]|nr:MAG: hypothetical protein M1823_000688 [Watsoniomyces obsoletus]